jgi:hypothetical protein
MTQDVPDTLKLEIVSGPLYSTLLFPRLILLTSVNDRGKSIYDNRCK